MIRGSMVALLVGLGVYALIAGFMFFNQRQLLYHPDIKQVDPATLGITGAEVTAITTPDGEKLVAWYAPAPAGRPTVLFLHGNAGSIAERPLRFQYYRKAGFGVLYLSWRGYGGSTGQPSERGLMVDADAAYDWLMAKGVSPGQPGGRRRVARHGSGGSARRLPPGGSPGARGALYLDGGCRPLPLWLAAGRSAAARSLRFGSLLSPRCRRRS